MIDARLDYHERVIGGGPPQFLYDGLRRVGLSPFASLSASWLKLQTGAGGVCFGDSGGPQFLGSSDVLVATTSGGDSTCSGMSSSYRLDTASARQFLGQFVELP